MSKKDTRKAAAARHKKKEEMKEHLDSAFVIVKPKTPDEKRFEDDFDKIFKWHTSGGEYELSETLKQQLDRWSFARSLFLDDAYYRNMDIAYALVTQYKISVQQAYKDIANCKRLYQYVEKADYEFEKVMHIERIKRHMRLAEEMGAKGIPLLSKLDRELTRVFGFDTEKSQAPIPIDINIVAMDNPELVGGKRIPDLEDKIEGVLQKALKEKMDNALEISFEEV